MKYNNFLTTIEWHEPDDVPDRSNLIMIVLTEDNGRRGDVVQAGFWDAEHQEFQVFNATCDWDTVNIAKVYCWAFWPHPPGSIPNFARENDRFQKVVKID
ncbi:hypothetical protein LCGC14_0835900 [marine sediment metagenome]|uniref:Uncharacterized protein n=1 Tax=marine sediment metagenome TaxID=412755 RepID=A0A0F9PEI3_9ZZZZ